MLLFLARFLAALMIAPAILAADGWFEVQVVDDQTGRGVPLVELETVNRMRWITDSAGRAAICEPGLEGKDVFFTVRSHGYEFPKDGFGMAGRRLKIAHGSSEVLKIKRLNIAERLYRNTGQGIYRDSVILGHAAPIKEPLLNAMVAGQDSIQRVVFKGKIHWNWGDTPFMSYPLGNFRMSGATSELPANGGLDPLKGINYRYFTNQNGTAKQMFPIEPKGNLIWSDGYMVVPYEGEDRLIAHFIRLKGLGKNTGRGLAIYNDELDQFDLFATLDLAEPWRFPHGHPIRITNSIGNFYYFGLSFPNVRVRALAEYILNTNSYEAFTCLADGSSGDAADAKILRDAQGQPVYRWTRKAPPATAKLEKELIEAKKLKLDEAHFQPVDAASGRTVQMHGGTVNWNPWRKKWILIAVEIGGSSMLGELWYSEADEPTGPWKKARKIVTHDRYSFYNPAHHPFFDQEGGRVIYFEGTYTAEFSGNTNPTPRYDYNQVMYRLDLADERLRHTFGEK